MLLLIDNYDSFTYNLVHALSVLDVAVEVERNDALTVSQALARAPTHIVISPGPCGPEQAGLCLDLIPEAAAARIPLLGVCLGHQSLGHAFGGNVIRAPEPIHGKVDEIHHKGEGLFRGLPSPFRATRYHSLILERASLPACLEVTAETDDGLIMAVAHRTLPLWGVQFHPESIATEHGDRVLRNFLVQG